MIGELFIGGVQLVCLGIIPANMSAGFTAKVEAAASLHRLGAGIGFEGRSAVTCIESSSDGGEACKALTHRQGGELAGRTHLDLREYGNHFAGTRNGVSRRVVARGTSLDDVLVRECF